MTIALSNLTLTNARTPHAVADMHPTGHVPGLACAWDDLVRHITGCVAWTKP